MRSTQDIIENQDKYKDNILAFFAKELKDTRETLYSIKCDDEFIKKEKEKLIKKFKKTKTLSSIQRYFFLSNRRDEKFYVWWDEKLQEPLILSYGKK